VGAVGVVTEYILSRVTFIANQLHEQGDRLHRQAINMRTKMGLDKFLGRMAGYNAFRE
jgi:hypothetical protein